jgi:hemolysin activation/secretion protein
MRRLTHSTLALAGFFLLSALTATVGAQVVPTNVDAGFVLKDTQTKLMDVQAQKNSAQIDPQKTTVDDQSLLPESPKPTADTRTLFIKSIQLENAKLLNQAAAHTLIQSYEARDLTFDDIQELADKLSEMYRKKGYVTSRVYIPAQKMQDGLLKLSALEGRMGKYNIVEGRFYKASSIKRLISLKQGEAFTLEPLQKNLRVLNNNPDRNVQAKLKPGAETGETDVEFVITDRLPSHMDLSYDNLGRRLIGKERYGLRYVNNNVLGQGDTFVSSLSFTAHTQGVVNHYEIPINNKGTTLGFDQAWSQLRLGKEFSALNIKGNATTYTPYISQSLINREKTKLSADLAFDFKQMDTNSRNGDVSHDLLRIVRPSINLELYDKWGRTYIRNEFAIGLDALGGTSGIASNTIQPSRVGAGSKAFRWTPTIIRTQRLPWNSYGIFRALGQWSPDRLVSAEQFQAGGAFSVRGYPEGQIIGDNGYLLSGEWRVPAFFIPKSAHIKLFKSTVYLRSNTQFVTFADFAHTMTNRRATGSAANNHILGAGFGLRIQLTKYMTARFDYAWPLLDQPGITSPRLHFGLSSSIL